MKLGGKEGNCKKEKAMKLKGREGTKETVMRRR